MDLGDQDLLALDLGDQDLLGFLLEESGDLWAATEPDVEAPLDLELSPSEVGGWVFRVGEARDVRETQGMEINQGL